MVKKANSKALEYDIQEIATLQIPKQYRFGTEMARIPVRVLEKTPKGYRLATKYGELTTLWPHTTLNKITSQSTYPDLPTTGAAHKRDKITLPKAVAKENNRGSIAASKHEAQIQQELKGNRSIYYTETNWNPDWSWNDWIGFSTYENYYQHIFNYLKQGPPPPFAPGPTPISTSIFQTLILATEAILGVKLNYIDKGLQIAAP
ncbi:hypothetical protein F5882DRAFT_497462 [Hyaloscypha sp. PMI_1271]|nr:hypothetical protein F5882DRAFT_497462 [Hyaloscypha sp. PMI_1271]